MSPTGYPDYPTSLWPWLNSSRSSMHRCPLQAYVRRNIAEFTKIAKIGIGLMKKKRLSSTMRARLPCRPLLCAAYLCIFCRLPRGRRRVGDDSAIDLVVYYDTTSGVIEEVMQNNQQVSETGVESSLTSPTQNPQQVKWSRSTSSLVMAPV